MPGCGQRTSHPRRGGIWYLQSAITGAVTSEHANVACRASDLTDIVSWLIVIGLLAVGEERPLDESANT